MLRSLYLVYWCIASLLPLVVFCDAYQHDRLAVALEKRQENASAPLSFGSSWQVLATWGADPLEYVGGFRSLHYDPSALFRSSLPANGSAKWNISEASQTSQSSEAANATLSISHSNVNWDFLKIVYGWAAVQYQSWARGTLTVTGDQVQHVILYTDAVLEFWVDDTHYFGGDFFTFRNAPPVLHLAPGDHQIDLRLVRDVRAFGGILAPTIDVIIHAERVKGSLELVKPGILVSDVVGGRLASPVGSIVLRNSGEQAVEVIGIQPSHTQSPSNDSLGIVIAAGQTRPVAFNVSLPSANVSSLSYFITYKTEGEDGSSTLETTQNLTTTSIYEPHKITYLHPAGMASYTMLRPPAGNISCASENDSGLPVLLGLHGAGLEADNDQVSHALDSVPDLCAWVMFPTGVTPWSGDDWHNWGFADVEAAVNSISTWIDFVGWHGPGVNTERWIVSGHSNGGQGTWYALTHRPDKVLAAAPVSGYASIQKYVPYELWQPADPRRTAVVSASLNSYRHEMLMPNARGIPIQQQHGEIDDNVPAYNSRLLSQQLYLSGTNSSYNEVPGQNHWWETVMTTPQLVDFYYTQTKSNASLPRKLDEFEMVVGDPGDMGSKGGLRVLSLEDPGQYGRVHVKGHTITTSNVLSLEFDPIVLGTQSLTVDGSNVALGKDTAESSGGSSITIHKQNNEWHSLSQQSTNEDIVRSGRQLGAMTAILRSQGPFTIQHQDSNGTTSIALQVSRNLYQYFHADAFIQSAAASRKTNSTTGNLITIVLNSTLSEGVHPDFPITPSPGVISIRDGRGGKHAYGNSGAPSIGAAFLRPLEDERLELVIWGSNEDGLRQAARMVPMVTGVGQPDFVVLGAEARWKGVDGALALGFLDRQWEVTASSFLS
ncbi:unnamed protein product [Periconia digitata]|uniref:Peptidase S9 prolyl oligopeptidase catalytic domain-containing protein n=1 Tax=Periconia digitata TaxID=1303443 RepID=A0A9W4XMY8_9PLEO|nr:unnamed protein product [Periconia digitata]